jgi:hypothetical protein
MNETELNKALNSVGDILVERLKTNSRNDGFYLTGKLNNSWRYDIVEKELKIYAEKYAGALSSGINNKGRTGKEMYRNLGEWARKRGMQPLLRKYSNGKNTGRFRKVTESSYTALGFLISRSIAKKGISERFGYKGSGFIELTIKQTKKQIENTLSEAYLKDITNELNNLGK